MAPIKPSRTLRVHFSPGVSLGKKAPSGRVAKKAPPQRSQALRVGSSKAKPPVSSVKSAQLQAVTDESGEDESDEGVPVENEPDDDEDSDEDDPDGPQFTPTSTLSAKSSRDSRATTPKSPAGPQARTSGATGSPSRVRKVISGRVGKKPERSPPLSSPPRQAKIEATGKKKVKMNGEHHCPKCGKVFGPRCVKLGHKTPCERHPTQFIMGTRKCPTCVAEFAASSRRDAKKAERKRKDDENENKKKKKKKAKGPAKGPAKK